MTIEQAKEILILAYGIDNPTQKQIADYIFFGKITDK